MIKNIMRNRVIFYTIILIIIVVFITIVMLNYRLYKLEVKVHEDMLGKKIYSNVSIYAGIIDEKIIHSMEKLSSIRNGFLKEYTENQYDKDSIEKLLNEELEIEKGFLAAYVIIKNDKTDISVYYDDKALYMAEVVYNESKSVNEEIYVSDFKINIKNQYIGIAEKIDKDTTVVGIYNFRYIVEKYIEKTGVGSNLNYFLADQYGNIIFSYEREKIGSNLFVAYSDNEERKNEIKNYLEKDRGILKYNGKLKNNGSSILRKITAWSSFQIKNKKVIVAVSEKIEGVQKNGTELTEIVTVVNIGMVFIFICIIYIFYNLLKKIEKEEEFAEIKEEKNRMENAIVDSNSAFWEYYPLENRMYFSEKFYEITGYNINEFDNNMESLKKIIPENEYLESDRLIKDSVKLSNGKFSFEIRIKKKSGRYIWFLNNGKAEFDEDEKIVKAAGILTDITALKQKEGELASFKTAVEQSPVTIVFTDTEGNITYVNNKFTQLTGYSKEEAMGENPRILKSERHDKEFYRNMWDTLLAGAVWSGEVINRKKDGELYYERANIAPITDENKKIVGYVAIKEDVTNKKEFEIKMEKFATRDELTGVLNRRAGLEFLEQEIKVADRKNEKFSLIYIDVNNLKYVNDNLGHNYGDNLIVEVCGGIKEEIRSSDIIARLGGDEFMVVMPECDKEEAEIIWTRIVKTYDYLNNNFKREYLLSASHGVYEYIPGSGKGVDYILESADREMYEEKKRMKKER